MNVHIDFPSYEAKTRANMKAIRARLMKPKAYKPTPAPTVDYFAPEWMRKITRFDHHVVAYYRRMETLQKYQDYEMPVRPSWKWKVQTFSQHIVEYYEFKKAVYDRQKQLDDVFPTYMRKPLPDILQEVKSLLDCQLSADELRGASRVRTCVEPRQYAMWAMRRLRPDMSYPQIGRFFGGRDHTTVLHGERKIEDLIKSGKSKLIYDGNQIRKVETKTRTPSVRWSKD